MNEPKGWSHDGEFDALAAHARRVGGPFLEIGTYAGRSALALGAVAKDLTTLLFCVDHHRGFAGPSGSGSPEMAPGQDCFDPEMVRSDGRFDSLPDLRRNLADADLEGNVIPIVAPSQLVAPWWTTEVGLVFIDGGHDADTVLHDFHRFAGHIRQGGVLAFHDATNGGPADAADAAEACGWTVLEQIESLRVLTR